MTLKRRRTPGLKQFITGWIPPIAAIALIWAAMFLYISQQRSALLAGGQTTAVNLAHAFEESLSRTIREVDQTLLYVRELRRHEGNAVDLKPWIESADPGSRLAAQISTTDKSGIVTLSNLLPPKSRIDLSDRPHFRHFADHPDDHLFISVPVLGRVSQQWTIQFVRMLMSPVGAFDGIIVLSVPPEHLVRLYGSVDVGKNGRIAMIGLDGVIRARAGGVLAIGHKTDGPVVTMAGHADSGTFEWTDPEDNIKRIGSFRRVPGYPFVVVVEMSEREVGASVERAVPGYLTVATLLTLAVLGLATTAMRRQQQAEGAHELTRLALEHVGVGIMVFNAAGRVDMFNSRASAILSMPPDIAPGIKYAELVEWQRRNGELTSEHMAPDVLAAKLGSRAWHEIPRVFRRSLPNGRIIETHTEALEDGTTVQSFTDITAAEEAQRVLTEARDAAEAAVRSRAQFLAAMSHEIRTPLNGILGVNEILATTAMTDMQRDYVKIIQQSGTHLLGMLSEILDYSKIEQQGVDLELIPFDPAAVLREVSAMLAPAAASHDLVLEVQAADGLPRQLVGDPVRVRQVLLNLVGNAIKFTPSGRIDVSLTGAHVTNGQWRVDFAVRDTGIGIAPEALGKLFLEFSQTDGSISRRFGGTGLGLAISRRIIEAMAGSICVDSTPGKGSTFSFYILADAVTEIAMDATVADKPIDIAALVAAQCPVVLLAEDNQVNRFVATRLLERIGCKVVLAENGREAVEAVRNNVINLVLMDVMMPEMDGLAATRAIRALVPPLNAIPIIGLSANAFRSDAEDGRAAGMNDFLTKPIDSARLLAAIGAVCQGAAKPPQPRPARLTPLQQMRDELGDETVDAVIEAFQTDVPKMLTRLRTQAEAGTAAGVAREAHALAGTAGSLGLAELSEAAREVEREARRTAAVPGTSTLEALENRFLSAADAMTEDMAF